MNLLLNSSIEQNSTTKIVASWDMSSPGIINETYTFTACLTASQSMTGVVLYRNGGDGTYGKVLQVEGGKKQVVSFTFVNTENLNAQLIKPGLVREPISDVGNAIVHWAKLERGTVTDPVWTPAPQDVLLKGEMDGRNLVLNSGLEIVTNNKLVHTYDISEPFEMNKIYTLTVWGDIGDGGENFGISIGISSIRAISIRHLSGLHIYYLIRDNAWGDASDKSKIILGLYNPSTTPSTVHCIKLEKGINPDPHWTPAPEDVVVRSELEELIKRVFALEAQASITSADSSAELPSADVTENADNMEVVSPMQEGDYMEEELE